VRLSVDTTNYLVVLLITGADTRQMMKSPFDRAVDESSRARDRAADAELTAQSEAARLRERLDDLVDSAWTRFRDRILAITASSLGVSLLVLQIVDINDDVARLSCLRLAWILLGAGLACGILSVFTSWLLAVRLRLAVVRLGLDAPAPRDVNMLMGASLLLLLANLIMLGFGLFELFRFIDGNLN